MRQMRKMSPKTAPNDRFFVEILNFFRKAQDHLKLRFMMFFNVLELWEPSWNDFGSTLDHSFFYEFSQKLQLNNSNLHAAST